MILGKAEGNMENLKNELLEAQVGKVLENEPLANHTTMKIGGPADLLIIPKDIDAVKTIMDHVKNTIRIGRSLEEDLIYLSLIREFEELS